MQLIKDLIYKKTNKYPCVLPDNLKNYKGTGKVKLHNDWPWPASNIPRSWNVKGPRCLKSLCKECDGSGYAIWPPKLVEGKSVCRWENSGASSILYVPELEGIKINSSIYGEYFKAWETNPGNPNFRNQITFQIRWQEHNLEIYSPSALQRWSSEGYLRLNPGYYSKWKVLKKREDPFKSTQTTGEDTVIFMREGWRPDHLDIYYNYGPMTGLQMD